MPYYQLIVGTPESVPFDIQQQLSADFAVGRLDLRNPEAYRSYAERVVAAERGVPRPARATFFAPGDDPVMRRMREHLIELLHDRLERPPGWDFELVVGEEATKETLVEIFAGDEATPGLLLIGTHGWQRKPGHPEQRSTQGGLVAGPRASVRTTFCEADLVPESRLDGLITFLFGSNTGGTQRYDNFPHHKKKGGKQIMQDDFASRRELTERPFVAGLPRAMLEHGALGVVGQVGKGWTVSFQWDVYKQRLEAVGSMEDALRELLRGRRLGDAMSSLSHRCTVLAAQLAEILKWEKQTAQGGEKVPPFPLLGLFWTAYHDAKSMIILGDPAVRILGCGSPE